MLPRKLVVFDVDGTLLLPGEVDDVCFVRSLREIINVSDINMDWGSYDCPTDSGIILEIALKLSKPDIPKLLLLVRKRYYQLLSEEVSARRYTQSTTPGAIRLLRMLVKHPIWCPAIATGGWLEPITLKLALSGINIRGIPLASSDDSCDRVDIIKCSVNRAARKQGVNYFQEIVYVGDANWDQIAAERLGVCFIRAMSDGNVNGLNAVELFREPAEFICLLDQLSSQFYQDLTIMRPTCLR